MIWALPKHLCMQKLQTQGGIYSRRKIRSYLVININDISKRKILGIQRDLIIEVTEFLQGKLK